MNRIVIYAGFISEIVSLLHIYIDNMTSSPVVSKSKELKESKESKSRSSKGKDQKDQNKISSTGSTSSTKIKGSDGDKDKKTFKVVIRKLPVRAFNIDDFRANVSRVLVLLGYPPNTLSDAQSVVQSMEKDSTEINKNADMVIIEHFIEGKLRSV